MPRRPGDLSPVQHQRVVLPRVHLARDYPPDRVARMLRTGEWERIGRGAYITIDPAADVFSRRRSVALARLHALATQATGPFVVSHVSAALLLGLPLPVRPAATHVTVTWRPGTSHSRAIVRHTTRLSDEECTERLGLRVTTLERTAVDCALSMPPRHGLIIADAALHNGADRERTLALLDAMGKVRGARKAREVLTLADAGSESPGESTARFHLLRVGLPAPETQVRVPTSIGTFWADLGWPQWRLLIEYDGEEKYTANGSATEAIMRERARERAIEETGQRMERTVKRELRDSRIFLGHVLPRVPPDVVASLRPRRLLNVP